MEFMKRPSQPTEPLPKVRYAGSRRYDGGDWFTYPTRVGKAWLSIDTKSATSPFYQIRRDRMSIAEQEDFFQTWLLFGVISELIRSGPDSSSLDEVYTTLVQDDCISTNGLVDFLFKFWEDMSENEEKELFQRVHKCVVYVSLLLAAVDRDFDHDIKFSIAAFGEFVSTLCTMVLTQYGITPESTNSWRQDFYSDKIKKSMISHGWCPSDISAVESKFHYLPTQHYIRYMEKQPFRDHSKCSILECTAYQIHEDSYRLAHTDPACSCPEIGIGEAEIVKILQTDQIPLIKLSENSGGIRIEVVNSSPGSEYVAISHVWADGLGNPFRTALQKCQLRKLMNMMTTLQSSSKSGPLLLWIDTLMCPIEINAKLLALAKIKDVYAQAKHVLVLDAGLQSYEANKIDTFEALIRIFTSAWIRRLWTLQEGALAESLWFQFADVAVSLEGLMTQVHADYKSLMSRSLCGDILLQYWRIEAFFHYAKFKKAEPDLAILDIALQHRGVSVASDESLCIATLMSLPMDEILAVSVASASDSDVQKERMRVVWKLLAAKFGGLPSRMIFQWHNYIDIPGWRWAPLTFKNYPAELKEPSRRRTRWDREGMSNISDRGLRVRYPGFLITRVQYDDGLPHNPFHWDYGLDTITEIERQTLWFHDTYENVWHQITYSEVASSCNGEPRLSPAHGARNSVSIAEVLRDRRAAIISDRVITPDMDYMGMNLNSSALIGNIQAEDVEGISVQRRYGVVLSRSYPAQQVINSIVKNLALTIRKNPLTLKRLSAKAEFGYESQEHKQAEAALWDLIVQTATTTYEGNEKLREAISAAYILEESTPIQKLVFQIIYYFARDYVVAKRLPNTQVWFVD